MELFCCEHVTRSYQNFPVVEDVSITLGDNELVSLLGSSGVGKTTLFGVLAGVDKPDSGKVLLQGEDITGVAGKVSYMLQKDLLLPYKTILDNVSLPLVIRGTKKKEARDAARPYFAQFGLEGFEDKYPYQLSGGMRQRAALLRTHLLHNPVMLLDEPFSALDAITKRQMHRWYMEIMAQMGNSTIFITHDVDEALVLSDRIYILAGRPGKITREFAIDIPRPRPVDFLTSPAFMEYKREILKAIET